MSEIILTELFKTQAKLDETIAINHGISYATTRPRRILSLLVEIGELANATRCFKYWSNKGSESKERVLDEYADGLHFFLSLGIDIKTNKEEYDINVSSNDLTSQFHKVYSLIEIFKEKQNDDSYIAAFQTFFDLIPLLGSNWQEVREAYFKKVDVNYIRQETNY